ncbi:MAG TPA: ABC transporter substrate-binding protein [Planctomycetota bacterium]|jgi:peptide/nickel transport system substrate-binding protein/oligopeptide transport system substrate-binding protein
MNRIYGVAIALFLALLVFLFASWGEEPDFAPGTKVFRFPLDSNPPSLDPAMITDVTSDGVGQRMYNTLLRFDRELNLIPELASEMPIWDAKDNSYTFKLRTNVTFHNGRRMTAADVKYSWERLLDPDVSKRTEILAPVLGAQEKIDGKTKTTPGIQVLDEFTLKVLLTGPNPTFLYQIAMICAAVIPHEGVEAAEKSGHSFSNRPVGTGPFKLVEWIHNRKLVFVAHEQYFKGRPKLDGLLYQVIPSAQVRLDRFLKREFEVSDIPFGQYKKISEQHKELTNSNPALRTNYLGILMNRKDTNGKIVPVEPLGSNPKLRQAINCAINREHLTKVILEGRGQPANSILPPGMHGHDPQLKGWTYDVPKARALLAEAGYPDGNGLEPIDLYYRKDDDIERVVVAIQNDLKAAGIPIELRSLEWGTFLQKMYGGDPPKLFYLGWVADFPDPDNFLYWLFHTSQWGEPGNETHYSNPRVDELTTKARLLMDQPERLKLYNEAEKIIVGDCPWILLEWRTNVILLQPYVKAVREQLNPLDVGAGLNQVDFSKVEME